MRKMRSKLIIILVQCFILSGCSSKDSLGNHLDTCIGILSFVVSVTTLFIYIQGNHISRKSLDMQYKMNSLNLNMTVSEEHNNNKRNMVCKIVNDAGNIHEAILTPYMYLELRHCPNCKLRKSFAIRIHDFFSEKAATNLYWSDQKCYNIKDNSWTIIIDKNRFGKAMSGLLKIQAEVQEDYIFSNLSLCIKIQYVDFMENSHIEWFYVDYMSGVVKSIEKRFSIPLETYVSAPSVDLQDIDLSNDVNIKKLARKFKMELFCENIN